MRQVARVWRGSSEADLPASAAPDTVRVAEFTGRFEPVQHRCGAPLPSGRLCPRADRLRCPLHGPIIPRDSRGEPLDPAERSREKEARARGPDWQVRWRCGRRARAGANEVQLVLPCLQCSLLKLIANEMHVSDMGKPSRHGWSMSYSAQGF